MVSLLVVPWEAMGLSAIFASLDLGSFAAGVTLHIRSVVCVISFWLPICFSH